MSYAYSGGLQARVYQRLIEDPALSVLVGGAVYDAPLALEAGRLVALRFLRAGAERGRAPEKRRVSLRFRAVVDQD